MCTVKRNRDKSQHTHTRHTHTHVEPDGYDSEHTSATRPHTNHNTVGRDRAGSPETRQCHPTCRVARRGGQGRHGQAQAREGKARGEGYSCTKKGRDRQQCANSRNTAPADCVKPPPPNSEIPDARRDVSRGMGAPSPSAPPRRAPYSTHRHSITPHSRMRTHAHGLPHAHQVHSLGPPHGLGPAAAARTSCGLRVETWPPGHHDKHSRCSTTWPISQARLDGEPRSPHHE